MAYIQKITRCHTDKITGKQKQIVKYRAFIRKKGLPTITKTFSRKKTASDFIDRIVGNREAHLALGHSKEQAMTLGQLIDQYLAQWEGSSRSVISNMNWWKTKLGSYPIAEIDKSMIKACVQELTNSEALRYDGLNPDGTPKIVSAGKMRTPATINRYKAALSAVYNYGVSEHDLPENPMRKIKSSRESAGRIRYLSDTELKNLLQACRSSKWERLYLLVFLAITTGARQGELLRLTWDDIDFKRKRASVHKTKNQEKRVLPLTNETIIELLPFRKYGDSLLFPAKPPKSQALQTKATLQRPFTFNKHWHKAISDAGIINFRFHDLRHTCASYLAQNGATLLEIAEVLGHKQLSVTQRYAHLCIEHKANLVNKILGGLANG